MLRKKAHKAAAVKPLGEVKDQIRAALAHEKASDQARDHGKELIKMLQGGKTPEAVAKESKLTWQRPGFVQRDYAKVDNTLVRDVFKQATPGDKPMIGGLTLT